MKSFLVSILIIFLLAFAATAQEEKQSAVPTKTETLLRVETENGRIFELKATDLAKLPRHDVKGKTHAGAETNFSGVDVREVLKLAGVKFGEEGKKANLSSYLIVEAADNYRAVFALIELEPEFTDKIVLLADKRDGKFLSKEEGSLRLVVPDEKKQGRWVRQVVKLSVKSVNSKVSLKIEPNKASDEDAIRETIFAMLLRQRASVIEKDLKAYYLAVDNIKDPSDSLLKKFADYSIPVKKSSESSMSQIDGSVVDVMTKEHGILFSVSKIDWIDENTVKVNAYSYIGNVGGDGCLYILKRENEKWKITFTESCFVS